MPRVRFPRDGEIILEACMGWWEEQCLILHGQSHQIDPNPLVEKYGVGTAKKLWDRIARE